MNDQAERYDAVVVGARCAGASLAIRLARAGWRVALVDRDQFPSDTISTHVMFPDSLHQLEHLGAMDRLQAKHRLTPVGYSWRVLGQEVAGRFTPVGAYDRCLSVRRITLDGVLLELAAEAGVTLRLGTRASALLGAGTADDPARGVVLDDGRRLLAPWILAADGQRSTIARKLGLEPYDTQRGEISMLFGYWTGLPPSDWCRLDMREQSALMSVPCEDGLHLLAVAGPTDFTKGGPAELECRYRDALHRFPAVLNPRLLAGAELVSTVVAAPETMLRGFCRTASGPGWALVGDAGHLTHPSTAQGIGDALHESRFVAEALINDGNLAGYQAWRDARIAGHYEWSFQAGRFPGVEALGLYTGLAADRVAGQAFLDTFTKRTRLSEVLTPERSGRWRSAAAYEDGLHRLCELVESLDDVQLDTVVPACPDWRVRDLLAHLVGVAQDSAHGRFFPDAIDAWRDPELARQREAWTAGHVASRKDHDVDRLVGDLQHHGQSLLHGLRSGVGPTSQVPAWMIGAPVADLAVHLDDMREAVGARPQPDSPVFRAGFGLYRRWLSDRLQATGRPALRLSDGREEWITGPGDPGATVTAQRQELFRVISGRRSATAVKGLDWDGDPEPYLAVISPYPLPI